MNAFSLRSGVRLVLVLWLSLLSSSFRSVPTETATARIVRTADAFLATLGPKQTQRSASPEFETPETASVSIAQ
jgi:hypothetical protein